MKEKYSIPQTVIVELHSEPLMSVTSGEQGGVGVGGGTAGDGNPDLSACRRGVWGNLWCE